MQLNVISYPHCATIIAKSSWPQKKLADYHVEALVLCEYKCAYCSSNSGRHLKTRPGIAAAVTDVTGQPFNPHDAADTVIRYDGVVEALQRELASYRSKPGHGKTLVYSQLTDGFCPIVVQDGTARRILELLIEQTEYRIRILTKNAIVGSSEWVKFFQRHADRFVVGLSIGTLDDRLARRLEAKTSVPTARIKALRTLQDAGVSTYGMLCPVFPEVLRDDQLERLLDAIRPEQCEHIWAEPYNNRQNWKNVRECFSPESFLWNWMTQVFEEGNTALWSQYTTELYTRIRERALRDGWIDRLNYLLYEKEISSEDAVCFQYLKGVLLQSKPNDEGLSCHPQFAKFQTKALGM